MFETCFNFSIEDQLELARNLNWTQIKLWDRYSVHKFVYGIFTEEKPRFCFENEKDGTILLFVRSKSQIKDDRILKYVRWSKKMNKFEVGEKFSFFADINATKREKTSQKDIPLVREDFTKWLKNKEESNGFKLNRLCEPLSFDTTRFNVKDNNRKCVVSNQCCGELEVTNVELFENCLLNGIGKSRAFGFGCLMIK